MRALGEITADDAPAGTGDFQDIPLWRKLVAARFQLTSDTILRGDQNTPEELATLVLEAVQLAE